MAEAITQKKIDALAKKRPAAKREIPDGGQPGLYLVVGPRTLKWMIRFRAPGTGQNVKLVVADCSQENPALDLHAAREKPTLGLHDARKAAQLALQAVAEGRDPRSTNGTAARQKTLVEEAFADFIERHAKEKNKASTARGNEAFVEREILPKWRGQRIRSISRQDIIDLIDGIAEPTKNSDGSIAVKGRPQSAVRVRALLSKAFSWFATKSIIVENPFRDVEVPAPSVARDRILRDEEVRWLWQAANVVDWPFGPLVQLLLLTAQRRDEVAAARWSEFELDGANPSWLIPKERTKNSREQNLQLPSQATQILASLPRVIDDCDSPFILSTNGTSPISGYSRAKKKIDKTMLEIARKEIGGDAGITIQPWTLHDLRRTAASGMAALGFPIHVVEAVLNHKSGAISGVAAIYNRHDYADEKGAALAAWANEIDGIVVTRPESPKDHA